MQTEPISTTNNLQLTQDREQWLSNWTWRTVQCLVDVPGFNDSPKLMAQKIGISIENVYEALEGLERLGHIQRINGVYSQPNLAVQMTSKDLELANLFGAHSKISTQIMSKMKKDDAYTSQVFVSDKATISKYAPKFMELFKQMAEEGQRNGIKEVVGAQMCFVPLTAQGSAQ